MQPQSFLTPACPADALPDAARAPYIATPPAEDAPAAFVGAVAREEGASAMLTALQQAGVRVPLAVFAEVVTPLLLGYQQQAREVVQAASLAFPATVAFPRR